MIDYNETRGISKETLNELLQELNPDFIKKLPDTPQEILKFEECLCFCKTMLRVICNL